MKRVVAILVCFVLCNSCFSQAQSAYKQYLKNLCTCFQSDTAHINSMNDASAALGNCMNLVDTSLRNRAMKEKGIFKTDDESLIQFEKLFAMDLVLECSSFKAIIEKLSDQTEKRAIEKLPVLDTISQNVCSCLEAKGASNVKSVVINNITNCFQSSMVKHFDEIIRQYKITDDNQEMLSNIGDQVSRMFMKGCKFYLDKLNPVLLEK